MVVNGDRKRIMFLIGSMGRGGAERVISILANSYAERGWKVDVVMLLNNKCDYELNKNIKLSPLCFEAESRMRSLPKWINGIRRYITANKPEIIVSFVARINIITILSCIGLNQRIIVSERNDPTADGRSVFVRFATNILYPLSDYIVFQTKWAQSCFSKRTQKKSEIIPNPIHVIAEVSEIKKKKIVAVGRLQEQKNHAMLIRAFRRVCNYYPDYKLYIYGEGKLRNILLEQIRELDLAENVFLPGNVSNIHEMIADAEIFVLPSDYEGLSNALLEAMMMGLPCISTNCAGSNEIIKDSRNGLLTEIGDEEQLANAVISLIKDKSFAKRLGQQGKKSVEYMNVKFVVEQWDSIITN